MENTSLEMAKAAKRRFRELNSKGFDFRSFYNGFLEGMAEATQEVVNAKPKVNDDE